MGKQPKTNVYQFDAFQEMQAVKELRHEMKHLIHQELIYGNAWSSEKRAEVAARMQDIRELIKLLGG
jgi:hypothetical protein